ncbi:glycosyltransferase family 2 protein, partial [bacterium]|nr:glycosyltransferase family 2 protein [bacterium]
MKVAIDKNVDSKKLKKEYEYIYVFDDDEKVKDLVNTGFYCINKDKVQFADINLTKYPINCIKETNIEEKDWDYIPPIKEHKIGIIIPNFNYGHTIEKCLNSILNQTYQNFEIIFVDDCSTDNSVQIASKTYSDFLSKQEIDKDFGELKIIKLKQKRFNGGARNEAYLHLSDDVDYVFCVDSDDWLYDKHSLERINANLRTEPDVLFVGLAEYTGEMLINDSRIPTYLDKYEAIQGWSGVGKIIKKELATKQECLYDEGTLKEDRNQHYKICLNMKNFKILSEPVYVWNRTNTKSVTTIRDNIMWGTSTIRHYADTLKLYLTYQGQDERMDKIMLERVEKTKLEV